MAQAGKPGGGVSGKPGGGMGGLGGGAPMSAAQAASANGVRDQNLFTTVGGLSRPGGAVPPKPMPRPTGPSGPPAGAPAMAPPPGGPRPRPSALPPDILDPLINAQAPYPTNTAEGFAAPATAHLGSTAGVEYDPMTGRPIPKRRGRGDASFGRM